MTVGEAAPKAPDYRRAPRPGQLAPRLKPRNDSAGPGPRASHCDGAAAGEPLSCEGREPLWHPSRFSDRIGNTAP